MKLTKLFSILLIAVVSFSCSKSDDSSDAYQFNKDNLTGTYSLNSFKSKEIKTIKVEGFDVVTTIVSTGDTFDMMYKFDSNNVLTKDGTYRVTEVKTLGGETSQETYIIDLDGETESYSVNANTTELTIKDITYQVSNFSRTGFKISYEYVTVEENGNKVEYNEEWVFKK